MGEQLKHCVGHTLKKSFPLTKFRFQARRLYYTIELETLPEGMKILCEFAWKWKVSKQLYENNNLT